MTRELIDQEVWTDDGQLERSSVQVHWNGEAHQCDIYLDSIGIVHFDETKIEEVFNKFWPSIQNKLGLVLTPEVAAKTDLINPEKWEAFVDQKEGELFVYIQPKKEALEVFWAENDVRKPVLSLIRETPEEFPEAQARRQVGEAFKEGKRGLFLESFGIKVLVNCYSGQEGLDDDRQAFWEEFEDIVDAELLEQCFTLEGKNGIIYKEPGYEELSECVLETGAAYLKLLEKYKHINPRDVITKKLGNTVRLVNFEDVYLSRSVVVTGKPDTLVSGFKAITKATISGVESKEQILNQLRSFASWSQLINQVSNFLMAKLQPFDDDLKEPIYQVMEESLEEVAALMETVLSDLGVLRKRLGIIFERSGKMNNWRYEENFSEFMLVQLLGPAIAIDLFRNNGAVVIKRTLTAGVGDLKRDQEIEIDKWVKRYLPNLIKPDNESVFVPEFVKPKPGAIGSTSKPLSKIGVTLPGLTKPTPKPGGLPGLGGGDWHKK